MAYKEIKALVRVVRKRLPFDGNRPYKMRKKDGSINSFGKEAYAFSEIDQMLTQPLGQEEFARLSEGDKKKTWRFVAVISPERIDLDDQILYKDVWFEVKKINDWDSIMSGQMVAVA